MVRGTADGLNWTDEAQVRLRAQVEKRLRREAAEAFIHAARSRERGRVGPVEAREGLGAGGLGSGEEAAPIACFALPETGPAFSLAALAEKKTAGGGFFFYLDDPEEGETLAFGTVWSEAAPETGKGAMADALRRGAAKVVSGGGVSPRFFAALGFPPSCGGGPWRGWPRRLILLPRWLLKRGKGGVSAVVCARLPAGAAEMPEADRAAASAKLAEALASEWAEWCAGDGPEPRVLEAGIRFAAQPAGRKDTAAQDARWRDAVGEAAARARAGEYDKVVLAREAIYAVPGRFRLEPALRRLRSGDSRAIVFAVSVDEAEGVFLGASPERLVRAKEEAVLVDCLAGTAPRGRGPEEDARLGEGLLASAKDRAEHAWVVRGVESAASEVLEGLERPSAPILRKLPFVQHLYTPVTGRLRPGMSILDLAERLHPTPAVAGWPRLRALREIRRAEPMDRGWYAGAVGWASPDGGGFLSVALRCAVVRDGVAHLFAGVGVVGDSDPDAEFQETEWKFKTMLAGLSDSLAGPPDRLAEGEVEGVAQPASRPRV